MQSNNPEEQTTNNPEEQTTNNPEEQTTNNPEEQITANDQRQTNSNAYNWLARWVMDRLADIFNFATVFSVLIVFFSILGNILNLLYAYEIIIKPDKRLKTGWFITRITGGGTTQYNTIGFHNLFGFLDENIRSSSNIRSMIYTDFPITENNIQTGGGYPNLLDLSVLINKDQDFIFSKLYGNARTRKKINSQTLQSRLVKAYAYNEVLCILVTGYRDNNKSHFYNVLAVKGVSSKNLSEEYISLIDPLKPNGKIKKEDMDKHKQDDKIDDYIKEDDNGEGIIINKDLYIQKVTDKYLKKLTNDACKTKKDPDNVRIIEPNIFEEYAKKRKIDSK